MSSPASERRFSAKASKMRETDGNGLNWSSSTLSVSRTHRVDASDSREEKPSELVGNKRNDRISIPLEKSNDRFVTNSPSSFCHHSPARTLSIQSTAPIKFITTNSPRRLQFPTPPSARSSRLPSPPASSSSLAVYSATRLAPLPASKLLSRSS